LYAKADPVSYDIGSILYGSAVKDDPLFSAENSKQITFAVMFSSGAGKVLKMLAKNKKYKKLFNKKKLMRGVNSSNVGYSDALRGYVGGNYLGLNPWSTRQTQRVIHNDGGEGIWSSEFTSWTTKSKISKHFATRSKGKKKLMA
jgi:hypothetical protein